MGGLMRIDLRLEKPKAGATVVGSGFIALDVIEGDQGEHFAAGGTCGNVLSILAWLGWRSLPWRVCNDGAGRSEGTEDADCGYALGAWKGDADAVVVQRRVWMQATEYPLR
jgi:hypothetical protein